MVAEQMSAPKVSVILPTYNRAKLLGTAMESVLGQSFGDLELLVVDDGSEDDTEALVRGYQEADERVHYLRGEHRGISAALNAGIRVAQGKYVARMDSDDQWLPELLETEVAILEARPEIGLVYALAQWANADMVPQPNRILGVAPHFPNDALRSMLWINLTCSITQLLRRECFDLVGLFDESLVTSMEWEMQLRVAFHYQIVFVDRVLALVRDHDQRTTGGRKPAYAAFLGSRHKVLDKFFSRTDLPPHVAAMKTVAYRNVYVYGGVVSLESGDWRGAFPFFLRAVRRGGNPAATVARILWFTLGAPILERTAAGRNFLRRDSQRRSLRRA